METASNLPDLIAAIIVALIVLVLISLDDFGYKNKKKGDK